MQKLILLILVGLCIQSAHAQIPPIQGTPITTCADVIGKWHHDSSPLVEVNLTILDANCKFTVAAAKIFSASRRYTGQGYLLDGEILVLPLKEADGYDIGHFLLKRRGRAIGGQVVYEGRRNIELWPRDQFPNKNL